MRCNLFCELSKADIDFPVDFDLKIIVVRDKDRGSYTEELESVLSSIGIPCCRWREKSSSKGTYISYTVSVNVKSRKSFDEMYEKLKKLDYIKTVI